MTTQKELQIAIAKVLKERGGMMPENALIKETMPRVSIDQVEGNAPFITEIAVMSDLGFVERIVDSYGDWKCRLKEKGRMKYFGTRKEKMWYFLNENWLEIIILLASLGLFAALGKAMLEVGKFIIHLIADLYSKFHS